MAKNRDAIVKYSGSNIYYKLVDQYGGSTVTYWTNLGYVSSVSVKDITEKEDHDDMTGNIVRTLDNRRSVKIELLLMQSDKQTIDFLKEDSRNNLYSIMIEQGQVGGKIQEMYFGICSIRPQVELASGVKRLPVEITCLYNPYTILFGNFDDFVPSDPISLNDIIQADGRVYKCTTAGTLGSSAPTHFSGTEANGTAYLLYIGEQNNPSSAYSPPSMGTSLFDLAAGKYWHTFEHTI